MKIKNHIISQVNRLKEEIPLVEYISWWVMRVMMAVAFIISVMTKEFMTYFLVAANFSVMFVVSILSFIFPKKFFLGSMPFRIQTYINLFVIAGSFCGHFIGLYRYEGIFDKALHVVSGFVAVFIGYELMKSLSKDKELSVKPVLFGSFMFSYFVMVMWEVFEFFSDWLIKDSNNQAFSEAFCRNVYVDSYFFFKIFGHGQAGAAQYPILDTMIDILAAVIGSIIAIIILSAALNKRNKKTQTAETAEEEKEEPTTV